MKDFLSVIGEFENYLYHSGLYTNGTSKCYAQNYVKPAIEKLLASWFANHDIVNPFSMYNEKGSQNDIEERSLIVAISDCLISQEIKNLQLGLSAKTIGNWRSGLRLFFTFLETQNYCFGGKIKSGVLNKNIQKSCTSVVYSDIDLFNTFKARLITQDRAYQNMIYPARLINLIFNNSNLKDKYQDLLKEAINNTKFLIDKSKKSNKKLSDISRLVIDYNLKNGNSIIETKDDSWFVITENTKTNIFEKIQAKGLEDLSLDHDIPLQNILDNANAQKDYSYLKQLSDIYATYVNSNCRVSGNYLRVRNIRDFKNYSSTCYRDKKTNFDNAFIGELFNDLQKLYSNIGFTIMLRKYNVNGSMNM